MAEGSVWTDPEKSRQAVQEIKELKRWIDPYHAVRKRIDDARALLELCRDAIGFPLQGPALEHLGDEARVLLVRLPFRELEERARIVNPLPHRVVRVDPTLQFLDLLHRVPRLLRVGPDAALGHGVLQLRQALGLLFYVKESSAAR